MTSAAALEQIPSRDKLRRMEDIVIKPITNKYIADSRDTEIKSTALEHERPENLEKHSNSYVYEGYTVCETFDPNGPSFSDCIVRMFAG